MLFPMDKQSYYLSARFQIQKLSKRYTRELLIYRYEILIVSFLGNVSFGAVVIVHYIEAGKKGVNSRA